MTRRAVVLGLVTLGCSAGETFTIGRDLEICEANIPTACSVTARCELDGDHYLTGDFPGARRFIVRTDGEADVAFGLLLTDRRSPGTELRVDVHEPGCSDSYEYDSAGQDLFRLADRNGVIEMPFHVLRAGDHLVEIVSDAYCTYFLKVDF